MKEDLDSWVLVNWSWGFMGSNGNYQPLLEYHKMETHVIASEILIIQGSAVNLASWQLRHWISRHMNMNSANHLCSECSRWRDYREMSWMPTCHNCSLPTAHAENNTSGLWHKSPGVAVSRTGNPSSAPDSLFTHSVCQDVRGSRLIWPGILQRRRNALINPVNSLFRKIKSKCSFIALFNI